MLPALAQFLLAAALIIVGGVGLSRSADVISRRYGLGHLLGGALLIATATSLPDLVMGLAAARAGFADLVVGDLFGAALFNMLVLAVMDLLHAARGRMLSQAAAAHALSGTMSMSLLAVAGIGVVLPREMNGTLAGIGVGIWGVVTAYVLGIRVVFFDQQYVARKEAASGSKPPPHDDWKPGWAIGIYIISAALILFAGPRLAHAAEALAEASGLGRTFVGTALLPITTTLPELVAAITALRIRAFDLIVGNAFGSIAFNLFLLAPIDMVYDGSLLADASPTHVVTSLAAIVTVAIAIMGQLTHAEQRKRVLEPDAALVIGVIFGALALIYLLR